MAMMDSAAWSGQDHAMHAGNDEDYSQFLDMNSMGMPDGLQFDFQGFQDTNGAQGSMIQAQQQREPMDTPMSGTDAPVVLSRQDPAAPSQMSPMTSVGSYPTIPAAMIAPPPQGDAIVNDIDAQIQFLQQQKLQHQARRLEEQRVVVQHQAAQAFYARQQQNMIPPTPQSLEMQANNGQFYNQGPAPDQGSQQHPVDYRYQRLKDQQEMFTPLVSPAVTPLETHFPVDAQFTVPGAYFSPLSSPALHAQSDSMAIFEQRHGGVATTNSPGEMDSEQNGAAQGNGSAADLNKKARKTAAKARGKSGVRQSPIAKAQRRKTGTTPVMNAQVLSQLVESAEQDGAQLAQRQTLQPGAAQASTSSTAGTDSENGSVSPEALAEALMEMPPPPIPKSRSAKPSPFLKPQSASTTPVQKPTHPPLPGAPSPATPASLMKLSSPRNRSAGGAGSQEALANEQIESFELPESANFPKGATQPQLAPINTSSTVTPIQSPLTEPTSATKVAGFQPLPSPAFAKPMIAASASQSPLLAPGSGGLAARKTPNLAPRGSKKRSSVSSVHVSPALRPKISPSIKPLLPGGATAEDTASHLLATKSNYQRILEGNTVPGVSYPSELSTNLTSKRTSHKIAEQGRRNRINSALQEIATLLPKPPPKDIDAMESGAGSGGEGSGSGSGNGKKDNGKGSAAANAAGAGANSTPNSKASTVEMAIEYIKQLQREVAEANRRAEEAEKKLEMKVA